LFDYIENNSKIIAIKHEDLSLNPMETFSMLYNRLDINFTERNKNKIQKLTSNKNDVKAKNNRAHDFKRDSKNLVKNYKNILTEEEREYISNHTKEMSSLYYDY
jgi:hypothetical protein